MAQIILVELRDLDDQPTGQWVTNRAFPQGDGTTRNVTTYMGTTGSELGSNVERLSGELAAEAAAEG